MLNKGILCFFLLIVIFSCREDFESNVSTPIDFEVGQLADYQGEEDMVTSSVKGIVVDELSNPLMNASVSLGGNQTNTDQYGHFFFTDVSMNALGTVVNVALSDYHIGSKLFYPTNNAEENLEIVLTKAAQNDDISGLAQGTVLLDGDLMLSYPGGSFMDENGIVYEGTVFISSSLHKSQEAQFSKLTPGNFQAVDIENKQVGLEASALLQLSIADANGKPLQINPDSEVSITFPTLIVNDEQIWYYAEQHGLYTVNTELNDNIVRLKHNTSLLIAKPSNTIRSSLRLLAADMQTPLSNMAITVKNSNQETIYTGYSNSLGQATIQRSVVNASTLVIQDACGNEVYNAAVPNEDLVLNQTEVEIFTGDVYDCLVSPSTNNVIRIRQGSRDHYYYEPSSDFTLALQTCENGLAQITAIEDNTINLAQVEVRNLNDSDLIGDLFICEAPSINQLTIKFTESGEEYSYPISSTAGSTMQSTTFSNDNGPGQDFLITFSGTDVGDYSDAGKNNIDRIYDDAAGFRLNGAAEIFEVIRFGADSQIKIGSFEGTFENSTTNENVIVEGSFNFYRQE